MLKLPTQVGTSPASISTSSLLPKSISAEFNVEVQRKRRSAEFGLQICLLVLVCSTSIFSAKPCVLGVSLR